MWVLKIEYLSALHHDGDECLIIYYNLILPSQHPIRELVYDFEGFNETNITHHYVT